MALRYKKPPIKEAICDVRFKRSPNWDLYSPVKIYELLKSRYDGEPRQSVATAITGGGTPDGSSMRIQHNEPQLDLQNSDGTHSAQITAHTISIHLTGQYPGWNKFGEDIFEVLRAYDSSIGIPAVQRVGIRYVNEIRPNRRGFELSDYFTCPPDIPDSWDMYIGAFLLRVDSYDEDRKIRLTQTFASSRESDGPVLILDLDASREYQDSNKMSHPELCSTVSELRDFERHAFESLITDKSRTLFNGDDDV